MKAVSIVVPAHDEERVIGATLAALRRALEELGLDGEILVVDDASSDRTAEIARAAGVRVVSVDHRQIAATRNAGAAAARGDVLVFVDADTLVPSATLAAALEALEGGCVGGGARVRFDEPVPWHARHLIVLFSELMRWARLAAGCFVFARRSAFEAVGGFDESLYASEEIELSRALRRRGRFVVLKERVITSGRKIRTYSVGSILAMLVRLAFQGRRSVRDRRGLEMWYEDPRTDDVPLAFPDETAADARSSAHNPPSGRI